jgi:hypothetical protein
MSGGQMSGSSTSYPPSQSGPIRAGLEQLLSDLPELLLAFLEDVLGTSCFVIFIDRALES